jgi:hypothetical protein
MVTVSEQENRKELLKYGLNGNTQRKEDTHDPFTTLMFGPCSSSVRRKLSANDLPPT